jgi:putative transposase
LRKIACEALNLCTASGRFCARGRPSGFSRELPAGAIEAEEPDAEARNGNLATTVLGACIRDDADFEHHVDYIHFDPVNHGYVTFGLRLAVQQFPAVREERWLPADCGGDLAEIEGRFGE